ncbi:MAG: hypothetical protein OXR66_02000 [Candidatus Woesearchaeota archaeon]|nr:hypothetical protein [Candidatus Woesearchaeota archaeon]
MSKPEVLEKTPINVCDVKAALTKIRKSEEELNFRAEKTEEYAQDFAKLTVKQAKELFDKLQGLEVPRVKEVHLHKLIDIMPQSEKHAKLILSSYHLTVTNDNVKKIVDTIGEFAKV